MDSTLSWAFSLEQALEILLLTIKMKEILSSLLLWRWVSLLLWRWVSLHIEHFLMAEFHLVQKLVVSLKGTPTGCMYLCAGAKEKGRPRCRTVNGVGL